MSHKYWDPHRHRHRRPPGHKHQAQHHLNGEIDDTNFCNGETINFTPRTFPMPLAKDASVRTALEKLTEDIRFSDPVSDTALEATPRTFPMIKGCADNVNLCGDGDERECPTQKELEMGALASAL